ncbi:MAG: transcriptional regulator [Spirulinaceae cyanobacterium RM2_2_10]|nr:transcriptional regulator [Spirulinaceae cyanobacterium SM2_1_0]NJO19812.1 transcriptional regulator [Spirulinaceae cyanobacterium RM2_2_10]
MALSITGKCIQCGDCQPQCPKDAIRAIDDSYWIDPSRCDNCVDEPDGPLCVSVCAVELPPVPLQAKKGRCKASNRPLASPSLFTNGKHSPFASAIAIWELNNILSQQDSLPWTADAADRWVYARQLRQGGGQLNFWLAEDSTSNKPKLCRERAASNALQAFDIRAAGVNLIFAAHAIALDQPWQDTFIINDQQLAAYLDLSKRKDLNKLTKLLLIEELVQQPCRVVAEIHWAQQGKVPAFDSGRDRLWHLMQTQRHFETDELGCKHLVGLTFTIRAGAWAQHFLNQQACQQRQAFYQYGSLPQSLLRAVMTIWQQHDGAARLLLWLLFKTKMRGQQRLTVPTLMRIAYGERRLHQASADRQHRKRLIRAFESDLEVLSHYGIQPHFDPVTYPAEIQPLWAKLAAVPDDAEEAAAFWVEDGERDRQLTDPSPRGKWNRLLNARLLGFDLPSDWAAPASPPSQTPTKRTRRINSRPRALSSQQVLEARRSLQLSQRKLAEILGKSQSWVRDIENGRFQIKREDQTLLRQALNL